MSLCLLTFPLHFRNHLKEATVISSIYKDTHPAKHARCQFQLSKALRQAGQEPEADLELADAKAAYLEIVRKTHPTPEPADSSTKPLDQVHEKDFDSLIHISQR